MNPEGRCSPTAQRFDFLPVSSKKSANLDGSARRLARRSLCPLKEKREPFFPNTFCPNTLKKIIVAVTVSLEVKAQIEKWLTQSAFGAEKQCNQQPAQPAIAIEKGMDHFELHVNESGLDENRQLMLFVVKEMFEAV